jgi:pimeloyl-ACP methyl ester carboxylesterase
MVDSKKSGQEILSEEKFDDQPWWKTLPEDFYKNSHMAFNDGRHKNKVRSTAAVDAILRTGLASAVLASMAPYLLSPTKLQKDLKNLAFYKDKVDRGKREEVFERPPANVKVSRKPIPRSRFMPVGVHAEQLRFESPYQAINPGIREDYAKSLDGKQAAAQHWRHPDGSRPTIIFTHGFTADAHWLNSMLFSLTWLYYQGYDILLHVLPFHGARRGSSDWFSGMSYFSHGFAHMNEAFLHGTYDLRIWIDYLEAQGVESIGSIGYSLGGYTTALAASCDDRLKFAIPTSPAVLLVDMIMGWPPFSWAIRRMMKKNGLSLTELRHMTAAHCPLSWDPLLSPERLLVIGGAGDRFTAPQFVNALHEHWTGSDVHWFPGNHLMHLHQPEYLKLIKQFMDKACA